MTTSAPVLAFVLGEDPEGMRTAERLAERLQTRLHRVAPSYDDLHSGADPPVAPMEYFEEGKTDPVYDQLFDWQRGLPSVDLQSGGTVFDWREADDSPPVVWSWLVRFVPPVHVRIRLIETVTRVLERERPNAVVIVGQDQAFPWAAGLISDVVRKRRPRAQLVPPPPGRLERARRAVSAGVAGAASPVLERAAAFTDDLVERCRAEWIAGRALVESAAEKTAEAVREHVPKRVPFPRVPARAKRSLRKVWQAISAPYVAPTAPPYVAPSPPVVEPVAQEWQPAPPPQWSALSRTRIASDRRLRRLFRDWGLRPPWLTAQPAAAWIRPGSIRLETRGRDSLVVFRDACPGPRIEVEVEVDVERRENGSFVIGARTGGAAETALLSADGAQLASSGAAAPYPWSGAHNVTLSVGEEGSTLSVDGRVLLTAEKLPATTENAVYAGHVHPGAGALVSRIDRIAIREPKSARTQRVAAPETRPVPAGLPGPWVGPSGIQDVTGPEEGPLAVTRAWEIGSGAAEIGSGTATAKRRRLELASADEYFTVVRDPFAAGRVNKLGLRIVPPSEGTLVVGVRTGRHAETVLVSRREIVLASSGESLANQWPDDLRLSLTVTASASRLKVADDLSIGSRRLPVTTENALYLGYAAEGGIPGSATVRALGLTIGKRFARLTAGQRLHRTRLRLRGERIARKRRRERTRAAKARRRELARQGAERARASLAAAKRSRRGPPRLARPRLPRVEVPRPQLPHVEVPRPRLPRLGAARHEEPARPLPPPRDPVAEARARLDAHEEPWKARAYGGHAVIVLRGRRGTEWFYSPSRGEWMIWDEYAEHVPEALVEACRERGWRLTIIYEGQRPDFDEVRTPYSSRFPDVVSEIATADYPQLFTIDRHATRHVYEALAEVLLADRAFRRSFSHAGVNFFGSLQERLRQDVARLSAYLVTQLEGWRLLLDGLRPDLVFAGRLELKPFISLAAHELGAATATVKLGVGEEMLSSVTAIRPDGTFDDDSFPDLFLLWGEQQERYLERRLPELAGRLGVSGRTRNDSFVREEGEFDLAGVRERLGVAPDARVVLFGGTCRTRYAQEPGGPWGACCLSPQTFEDAFRALAALADEDPRTWVIVKPHPADDLPMVEQAIEKAAHPRMLLVTRDMGFHNSEILAVSSVFASSVTSMFAEALLAGVPSVNLWTPDVAFLYESGRLGSYSQLSLTARSVEEMTVLVRRLLDEQDGLRAEELARASTNLRELFGEMDGRNAERAVALGFAALDAQRGRVAAPAPVGS